MKTFQDCNFSSLEPDNFGNCPIFFFRLCKIIIDHQKYFNYDIKSKKNISSKQ